MNSMWTRIMMMFGLLTACSSQSPLVVGNDGGDAGASDAAPGGDSAGGGDAADASGMDATSDVGTDAKDSGGSGPRRVFISSTFYDVYQLGGLSGVDALCNSVASGAGLSGTWKAWMSSSTSPVKTRFNTAGGPFKLLNGTVIATDWAALTSGTLMAPINVDETKTTVTSLEYVWTGTTTSGDVVSGGTCDDWNPPSGTAGSYMFSFGQTTATNASWTDSTSQGTCDAGETFLYCFEQ